MRCLIDKDGKHFYIPVTLVNARLVDCRPTARKGSTPPMYRGLGRDTTIVKSRGDNVKIWLRYRASKIPASVESMTAFIMHSESVPFMTTEPLSWSIEEQMIVPDIDFTKLRMRGTPGQKLLAEYGKVKFSYWYVDYD